MVIGEETNGFALANTACVRTPDVKTVVVFWGASDVPSLLAVGCIRLTAVGGFMDDCKDSGGRQGYSIKVMGPLEVCIG